ncbi:MAG: type I polyketide synthase [Cyanobacteria bacterium P01_D01_bin.50]
MSNTIEDVSKLSPLKKAFLALEEMQAKLNTLKNANHEPIAIVGMGCRFPGGANNPESFWQLLQDGADFIREVPSERWDINSYYDSNPETPGKMYTRRGGFLDTKVDEFDPQFFGIVPREAVSIDPQQRLLLEVSWEALENAGMAADKLAGSKTGVFVGINASDYAQLQTKCNDDSNLNAYFFTGTTFSVAAGRLSYILGLQGPTLALDTACSSSLVSVHLACQSLRSQECRMALAGGVNLMLSPQTNIMLSKMRALAADGRCKTFDAAADGYGRGEGCGVVVLKRLRDAVADGDNILALIRGSAINHDGSSSGLTVPNGPAQQELLRAAFANAKVEPNQVSSVEVHGTGTALGDPIEVEALGAFLGKGRSTSQPVALGSVKPDIGHLEAAAGIAGLIKMVLQLQHREFLPHRHLHELNPAISWDNLPVIIPTEVTPWSVAPGQTRLAGVSSFGMSGTNAHVVLEEPPFSKLPQSEQERPLHLLTLSAKSQTALKQLSNRYEQYLAANQDLALEDICFTANHGRSHFSQRLCVLAQSLTEVQQKLTSFAAGEETPGILSGEVLSSYKPKVAFLFTGQGSQYVGMGQKLYETQPIFRKTLDRCDRILRPYLEKPLLEVLYPHDPLNSPINETAYTQPALFALEYALAELWQSWGIKPAIVMGHSVGEYVAACVAGVFSLEDGLKLIAQRGRLMQALPQDGEMVAVLANETRVQAAIQTYTQEVAIAAFNGPENIVISGKCEAVSKVVAAMEADGVECKKLKVSHAFHSPLMEPMLADFEQVATEVKYSQPQISLISNITGELATKEIATPDYWCQHIRQPVKFAASTKTLYDKGYKLFLEIGAKPTISGMGRNCLPSEAAVWLPSLRPRQDDWQQMLTSLGKLYIQGVEIDWYGFEQDYFRSKVALPTYPFERQHYWVEKAHNGVQEEVSFSPPNQQTNIINLLHQGDTQNLAQQLEKAGNFSAPEVEFLPKILQVLAKQHNHQLRAATVKDWLYELDWQPQPRNSDTVPAKVHPRSTGTWLILADCQGIGETLAELLQQQGQQSILIYPGEEYNTAKTGDWSLNPSNPENFKRLFTEHLETSDSPLKGVIHLWSLDVPPPEELSLGTIEEVQLRVCGSTLHLVQTLAKYDKANSPQLWLVTQGAVPVKQPSPVSMAQASLWGLAKVAAEEHPELWGGIIDLDPQASKEQAATLITEIQDSQGEDNLAFRDGQRYGLRLVRSRQTEVLPDVPIKSDATYLITGGLGALGLKVAQWMIEQGAKHLVLIGRGGASPETQAILAQLEQTGTQVQVAKADVSDREDLVRVLEQIKISMPPLCGIVHTAGVLRDAVLEHQNWELFTQVMAPKIKGAWNLHSLSQELPIEFFVVFSSATSFLGSPGQGNYAAANAFLDALAYYRQSQGMPGLSVNWGPWAEVGMTARMDNRDQSRMNAKGLELMKPDYAVQALEQLLKQNAAQVGVFSIEWSDWIRQFPSINQPPYLKEIAQEVWQPTSEVETVKVGPTIFEQIKSSPSEQRQELLIPYLQKQIAKVLELDEQQISVNENLIDRGMDSLMVMEVINKIVQDLQLMLYPREFYDRPRIETLANYLLAEFAQAHGVSESEPENTISEDEILDRLRGVIHNLPTEDCDRPTAAPVFVLSSPRSGSTLFRVMLAGHPHLFSPPELHLLPFNTMAERNQELALSYFGEGLQRAFMEVMELDAPLSQTVIDEILSQNLSIEQVYALLQQLAGTRQLVDKSPTYGMSRDTLERAETMFKEAKYIYLTRHPYAVIESFVRMRMDKLVGASVANPYQVAEDIWANTNHNILDFLQKSVDPERYYQISYEQLVKQPEAVMGELCKFLNIPFEKEILQPYEGKRMTDGVHAQSMPIGDPNFAKYNQLDPKLGEVWRTIKLPSQLSESTQRLAAQLEYELPSAVETTAVEPNLSSADLQMEESFLDVGGDRLCLCSWGPQKGPLVLCLHGILEQGAAWEEVAIPLAKMGYRVVAPDLRGHGHSSHLGMRGSSIMDFLADIDALVHELSNQPFTLVGHSMGSIVAAMFASARPQDVSSLVLVETILPSPGSDSEVATGLATHLDYLASPPQHPIFSDLDTAAAKLRQATPRMSEELSVKLAKRIVEPFKDGLRWRWDPLLGTRTMMSGSGFPFSKARYIELLRQIQVSITLVYGDSSTFNRKDDLSEQEAAMPQAKRVVLSGGHNLHIDASEALVNIIVQAVAS